MVFMKAKWRLYFQMNKKMNKKGIGEVDYLADIVITVFLLIIVALSIFVYIEFKSESVDEKINDASNYVSINNEVLSFLRTPYKAPSIEPSKYTQLRFTDGKTFQKVYLSSYVEQSFELIGGEDEDIGFASMVITPSYGSNIAIIEESSDRIKDILEKEYIFPIVINWSELDDNFDVVFAGSGTEKPKDKEKVLRWVEQGGRLITTDHNIDLIDYILSGNSPIYSDYENIPKEKVKIVPTDEGKKYNLGEREVIYSFWTSKIVPGREGDVKVLAKYSDLDSDTWGYPAYAFNIGSGEIMHFTAFLGPNLVLWKEGKKDIKNLLEGIFKPEGEKVAMPELTLGKGKTPSFVPFNLFQRVDSINILDPSRLNKEICGNCNFPIKLKGNGEVVIKEFYIAEPVKDLYINSHEATYKDLIISAYYNNKDFSMLEEPVQELLDKIDVGNSHYSFQIIEKNGDDEKQLYVKGKAGNFGMEKEIVIFALPLYDPEHFLIVKTLRRRSS